MEQPLTTPGKLHYVIVAFVIGRRPLHSFIRKRFVYHQNCMYIRIEVYMYLSDSATYLYRLPLQVVFRHVEVGVFAPPPPPPPPNSIQGGGEHSKLTKRKTIIVVVKRELVHGRMKHVI